MKWATYVYAAENRLSMRWTVEDQSSQLLTNGLINQIICLQKSAANFFFIFYKTDQFIWCFHAQTI